MLYNSPRTIEKMFSDAANDSTNGIEVNWHAILISCGFIDVDKSTRNSIVCVKPSSQYHHDDLKEKTEWLRPYCSVDPLISTVVTEMDNILSCKRSD